MFFEIFTQDITVRLCETRVECVFLYIYIIMNDMTMNDKPMAYLFIQVVTLVLNTVSQVVAGLGCHYSEQDNGWLTQLLAKIAEHEGLIAVLVTFVWQQILVEVNLSLFT